MQICFNTKLLKEFLIAPQWLYPFLLELSILFLLVIIPLVGLMYYLLVVNRYRERWDYYQIIYIIVVLIFCCIYFLYIKYSIEAPIINIITTEPVIPVAAKVHQDEIISLWVIMRTLGQVSLIILMK